MLDAFSLACDVSASYFEGDASDIADTVLGPLAIIFIHALGLSKLVDFGTSQTSYGLLCESMRDGFAYRSRHFHRPFSCGLRDGVLTFFALSVLKELETLE